MRLNTLDRLSLLGILPRQGDMTTLRIVRDLERELSFTEDEHKELQFRNENGRVFWNPEADRVKEVSFGPRAQRLVQDALIALDKKQQLPFEMMSLYERFVGEEIPAQVG